MDEPVIGGLASSLLAALCHQDNYVQSVCTCRRQGPNENDVCLGPPALPGMHSICLCNQSVGAHKYLPIAAALSILAVVSCPDEPV